MFMFIVLCCKCNVVNIIKILKENIFGVNGLLIFNVNIRVFFGCLYIGVGNICLNNLFFIFNVFVMNLLVFKNRKR